MNIVLKTLYRVMIIFGSGGKYLNLELIHKKYSVTVLTTVKPPLGHLASEWVMQET